MIRLSRHVALQKLQVLARNRRSSFNEVTSFREEILIVFFDQSFRIVLGLTVREHKTFIDLTRFRANGL